MQITRNSILAITLGLLLMLSELFVQSRLKLSESVTTPDLQRIVRLHPDYWTPVPAKYIDPRWNTSLRDFYDVVVAQSYQRADGRQVTVAMVWSCDGIRRGTHSQELCYRAAGFSAGVPEHVEVSSRVGKLDANAFTAIHANTVEDVVYWRIIGGKQERYSNIAGRLNNLLHLFRADIPDNLMVRVSTMRSIHDRPSNAHIEYIKAFLEILPSVDRVLIMGRSRP